MRPVVNIHELETIENVPEGSTRYGAKIAQVGKALEMTGPGAMYVVVESGRRAFPFHNHLGNDEMFVILDGTGLYRFGSEELPVKPGDVCAAPRGGPDRAHQLVNAGDRPLRYLGISTLQDPDIIEYPDSGKFGALAIAPGPDFWRAHFRHIGRRGDAVGYYDGEEL